jgi:hypothetical protein
MREIRFRCWHTGRLPGVMIYDNNPGDCLVWKHQGQEIESIMQFTDFLDHQGKEIWEGDLLKDLTNGFVWEVFWNEGKGQWYSRLNYVGDPLYNRWLDGMEVVGNIYENPELLVRK